MEVKIVIELTASEPLLAAVRSLVAGPGAPMPLPAPAPEKTESAPAHVPAPEPTPEPEAAPAPAPEPEAQPATAAQSAGKNPTTADVRAAMERTRQRLEYPNGPEAERDEQLHRECTAFFKQFAEEIGGTKPSQLPADLRGKFIERLENLQAVSGEIQELPF